MPRNRIEPGILFSGGDRPNQGNGPGKIGANMSLEQRLMHDMADLAGR